VDLAVCCAIASNFTNKYANNDTVVVGEVGLGGEVRSVGNIEKRIQEAAKLGFKKILVPSNNLKSLKTIAGIELIPVENIISTIQKILK